MSENLAAITLGALQQRNDQAWVMLYDSLAPDLRSFIRRLGAHDVDDVLGETLLQLVRDIDSFSGDVHQIRPWAFRIARHRVIDASRRRQRRPSETALGNDTEPVDIATDSGGNIDLTSLAKALEILTSDQREILWLRYGLDMSLEDAADIVGSTPDAVASMAYRALGRLRKASTAS